MTLPDTLVDKVTALRPFVPARDLAKSTAFYEALGFCTMSLGDKLTHVQIGHGPSRFAFMLQEFDVREFAENFMMHMFVTDLDAWWAHVESAGLHEKFGVAPPRAPQLQSWGLRVGYIFDPSGVLWHVAQDE